MILAARKPFWLRKSRVVDTTEIRWIRNHQFCEDVDEFIAQARKLTA